MRPSLRGHDDGGDGGRVITAAGKVRATEPAQLQRSNQLLLGDTRQAAVVAAAGVVTRSCAGVVSYYL